MSSAKEMTAACTNGMETPCSAACPFHLNVREIISRLQRKNFGAVYRTLRNELVFPETAVRLCPEPCQTVCARRVVDDPVRLRLLELSAIKYAGKREPLKLNIPKKDKTIAIIGAGISGLACALRMTLWGYHVVVYEKAARVGGSLWTAFPDGDFLEEINTQFKFHDCKFFLSRNISDLAQISADAIYVATGKDGSDFGGTRFGVFLGGELVGADQLHALKQGIEAATKIEFFIKTTNMPHDEDPSETKTTEPDPWLLKVLPAVEPYGSVYNETEAVLEASRCLRCNCDICVRRCPLLQFYKTSPQKVADEIDGTVNPVDMVKHRLATRMVASCAQCGLCKESCPRGVDLQSIIMDARRFMVFQGSMPKAFSAFWLNDMWHAEKNAVVLKSPGCAANKYVFFPGCQLAASDNRYISGSYERLLERYPDTALWVDCCGAPAFWAGDQTLHTGKIGRLRAAWEALGRPQPVCACPTCSLMLKSSLPECNPVSLYSLDLGHPVEYMSDVSVFDPCSSRHDKKAQDGVRKILTNAGTVLHHLTYERENSFCCGWGGQYQIANPDMYRNTVTRNMGLSDRTYVTYCTNCRDTLAGAGKDVWHILDILLGLNDTPRKPPTQTQRRRNREIVKAMFLCGDQKRTSVKPLFIETGLSEKISQELILEDDISEVISAGQQTGRFIYDNKNACYITHHKIRNQTYWVVYRPEKNGYRILNAYTHRLTIVE